MLPDLASASVDIDRAEDNGALELIVYCRRIKGFSQSSGQRRGAGASCASAIEKREAHNHLQGQGRFTPSTSTVERGVGLAALNEDGERRGARGVRGAPWYGGGRCISDKVAWVGTGCRDKRISVIVGVSPYLGPGIQRKSCMLRRKPTFSERSHQETAYNDSGDTSPLLAKFSIYCQLSGP